MLLDHLDQHAMGQGRRDQEAVSALAAEGREGQAGVALDEAMRGEEVLDREAHAEDSLSAVGGWRTRAPRGADPPRQFLVAASGRGAYIVK